MRRIGLTLTTLCALTACLLPATHAGASSYTFWRQENHFTLYNQTIGMVLDGQSNVIVAMAVGYVEGEPPYAENATYRTIALRKFDRDGALVWTKRINPLPGGHIFGRAIAIDRFDNLFLCGSLDGPVDFGGGVDTLATSSSFVVKLDPGGEFVWRRLVTGSEPSILDEIAVDEDGSVVAVGWFRGTFDLGDGPITSAGTDDAFMLRFDANGNHQWTRRFGDVQKQYCTDVAIDDAHRVVVVGYFEGSIDLGNGPLVSAGATDSFLGQFDAAGNPGWSRGVGGAGYDMARDVAVDSNGDLIMIARLGGTVDLGGGPLPEGEIMAKYGTGGAHQWSRSADVWQDVHVGPDDNIYSLAYYYLFVSDSSGRQISQTEVEQRMAHKAVITDADGNAVVAGDLFIGEDFYGYLEDVIVRKIALGEPFIVSLQDVPGDQGRALTMRFRASRGENPPFAPPVVRYEFYRRDDPLGNWILVGSLPADGSSEYETIVLSLADSHNSDYFVRAASLEAFYYHDSTPLAAYSLDNLAPAAPTNISFTTPRLTWQGGTDADFDYFTVYGAQTPVFDETAAKIGETSEHFLDIIPSPYAFYFVTAVDFAGNESAAGSGIGEDNVAPAAPGGLSYVAAVLSWTASSSPDVDVYAVYGSMFPQFNEPKTTIVTTSQHTCDVSSWPYPHYFVTALDFASNESVPAKTIDSVPPAPPGNVQFDGDVISWDASTDPGLVEYVVYGSMFDNFANSKGRLGRPTTPSFDVSGFAYRYFFITVKDWNNYESTPATVADTFAPSAVVDLTYRSGILSWKAPPQIDIGYYTVYGSDYDSFDQPSTMIVKTTELSYRAADDGFPYHYISATDRSGNEGLAARAKTPAVVFSFAITAFPNPFNPETTIRYEVPRSGHAKVGIYDARGMLINSLVDAPHDAGSYDIEWRGIDRSGDPVGSGVYFARIEFGGDIKTRKLVLLK